MDVLGGSQEPPGGLRLIDRCQTGAHAAFPRRQLHVGRGLSGVKQDRPALGGVWRSEHNPQGRSRKVSGVGTQAAESLQGRSILDGNEVPGLCVLGGLGPAAGVQNHPNVVRGKGLGHELTNGALSTDRVGHMHAKPPEGSGTQIARRG